MIKNKKQFCVTAWQGRCVNSECPNYMNREIVASRKTEPALIVQMKHKDCGFKPKEN